MPFVVFCILSFLVGGVPFGYLVGRFVLRDDIRRHGSGNIGATNVARVIGWKWGAFVLVLDALKGLLPTLAASNYAADHLPEHLANHLTVATGLCAIGGHMYPIYLKLRGGKGVATALGVVTVLAPWPALAAFCVFAIVVLVSRLVAAASICASVAFGVTLLVMLGRDALLPQNLSLSVFALIVPGLIIWRHRSNIARILQGREPAVTERPDPSNKADGANADQRTSGGDASSELPEQTTP